LLNDEKFVQIWKDYRKLICFSPYWWRPFKSKKKEKKKIIELLSTGLQYWLEKGKYEGILVPGPLFCDSYFLPLFPLLRRSCHLLMATKKHNVK
jgi:hypothetical protein